MRETSKAERACMNPTEAEQGADTQIRRPLFRLISGLEKTGSSLTVVVGFQASIKILSDSDIETFVCASKDIDEAQWVPRQGSGHHSIRGEMCSVTLLACHERDGGITHIVVSPRVEW